MWKQAMISISRACTVRDYRYVPKCLFTRLQFNLFRFISSDLKRLYIGYMYLYAG